MRLRPRLVDAKRGQVTPPEDDGFEDRCVGALVGLAVGDALGTTLEFQPPGTFTPIDDMVGGGPFDLKPGEWTDDTSMALCLGESLLTCGFDPHDQLWRYVRWFRDGLHSSNGRCVDIGNTVRAALLHFEAHGDPERAGRSDTMSAGNGSIMRLAPVAICYAADPKSAIHLAGESSRTTHAHAEPVDACRYLAALMLGALQGCPKAALLADRFSPVPGLWASRPLAAPIDAVAAGSFRRHQPPRICGSGYVAASLEAALWAFATTDTFADGALKAVNLGDDADTTGAVYGQLAGAHYGASAIPAPWRARLAKRDVIEAMALRLAAVARQASRVRRSS
jgi:ADP-ribosylglycohydrolase